MLSDLFERIIFEPPNVVKWPDMVFPSRFIRPIHPKSMIAPEESAIRKVIESGWWAQPKIHGHRAQIHISSRSQDPCLVYTRQGRLHKEKLSPSMETELRRVFAPSEGWNAIDAEWLKSEGKLFVFDFLKRDGNLLDDLTFAQRYELLPKLFLSPHISTVPIFKSTERCLSYLSSNLPPFIEGLVFRAAFSPGFADSTIVRCRLTGFL